MMEFEYWWLLALPLFFTLGWLAARVDIKQLLSESTALPAAYFKGLNFLITDQHDKAIEAFVEAVEANGESLELHFALGSLFRRRGEVDRAINLHLSLLDRKELAEPQRLAVSRRNWHRITSRPGFSTAPRSYSNRWMTAVTSSPHCAHCSKSTYASANGRKPSQ